MQQLSQEFFVLGIQSLLEAQLYDLDFRIQEILHLPIKRHR